MRECERLADEAIRIAMQERDAEVAYHAAACAGRARLARAEPESALDHFREALELAKEYLHPRWLAPAHHDVFLAAREAGLELCAKRQAATAADLYRDFDTDVSPGLLALLADAAQMEADHFPDSLERARIAQDAWQRVTPAPRLPLYAFNARAQTMRAAAVLGEDYVSAVEAFERAEVSLPDGEHVARTLVYTAQSAMLANDFSRALDCAQRAQALAESRDEGWIAKFAMNVRADALAERRAPRPMN